MNTPRRACLKLRDGVKAAAAPAALLLLAATPALAQGTAHHGGGSSGGSGGSASHSSGSSASSPAPHTAHRGTPASGQRQPSRFSGRFRSFNGRGFAPGFRRPFFYPYGYDPYFYGGFGIGLLYGGYYPYYYDSPYYDDGYYGRDRYGETSRDEKGGINIDVSPADAKVYIDGKAMGTADDFDGWPDYLWLDAGTYDLVLYKQGYKTVSQQVTVYPGKVLDLDEKLESGPSTRPEDLPAPTHERRDARVQYERDRSDRIDRYGYDPDQPPPPPPADWRDRVRERRDVRRPPSSDDDGDSRGGVRFDIQPADASVYLDGRFIGTGRDVSRKGNLQLSPGAHKLAVVRPGRQAKEMDFDVKDDGKELDLSVKLAPAAN